jgi:hypothetical protein
MPITREIVYGRLVENTVPPTDTPRAIPKKQKKKSSGGK